ncbi:MAG TPA: S1 RNA-binding domain-containing protein, partial [Ignavibacteriaceae bacterium]
MAETKEKSDKTAKAKSKAPKESAAGKSTTKKVTASTSKKKDEEVSKVKKAPVAKAAAVEKKAPAKKTVKPEPTAEVKSDSKETTKPTEVKETSVVAETNVKVKATPVKEIEKPVEQPFSWESLGKIGDIYSEKDRKEMETMYDDTLSSISVQDVIDGEIVSLTGKEAVVNIGYKSDGVIPMSEMRYNKDIKVGDKVEVFIESQEDKNGQLLLSHLKARALRAWDRVNDALNTQEIIKGHVKCRTKGGLIVDVFGIEAFLPGSQIDVKPIRDYDVYVDKTMEFKVVKINKEFKNVVVSHKALIEAELEEQKKQIIAKLEKGQVLEGTVKNITSYGVFIDLGGVDGLVHITDLSWGRINHPEEIVQLDQKINVVILDFDDDKKRIALGMKQLQDHPWDKLNESLKV